MVALVQLGDFVRIEKGRKALQVFERSPAAVRRYLQIDDLRPDARRKFVEPFACPVASKPDVVIAWDGANARTVLCSSDGHIGNTLAILSPSTQQLFAPYLSRFLEGKFDYLQKNSTGATGSHVSRGALENLELLLPSLSEQKWIVGQSEQVDRLRRTRRCALELSDSFLPTAFLELFGDPARKPQWPLVNFGELIASGPQNGLYKPATDYGSGTPIVRINAYQRGEVVDFNELKRVQLSPEDVEIFGLAAGYFLINRINSWSHLGKSAPILKLSEPTVFESNMMRLRVNESVLVPTYALKFLQTRFLNAQIQKQAKDASNQSSINQDDVEGFAILLPSIPLQQQLAALIERHERLRATQCEALRQAEHLFQTLLHSAFNQEP